MKTDGRIEDLGVLITAAYGLDRTWTKRAKCRHWNDDDELYPTPWQFDAEQVVAVTVRSRDGEHDVELHGKEMIDLALMSCFSCPVQYQCAEYAVIGRVRAGTWSMRIADLRWLQAQPNWQALIAYAICEQLPLQRFVPEMRQVANS